MFGIAKDSVVHLAAIGSRLKPRSSAGRVAASARMSGLAAGALAWSFVVAPAFAGEYSTFHHVEITSAAASDCPSGALLTLPASWQPNEGAVVLVNSRALRDSVRDSLVEALLSERTAVLERAAAPCDATPAGGDAVATRMLDALAAMARAVGPGPVVAIGYGPDSRAVLGVLREPVAGRPGPHVQGYAAAVSIGDGAPAFVLAAAPAPGGQPSSLAPLCRAISAVAAGMGPTPQQGAAARVAESCETGMASQASIVSISGR